MTVLNHQHQPITSLMRPTTCCCHCAGSYPPVPATRSKDLRDLIDRMLTLDFNKRPSINDVLAAPVVKARIAKFLSATLHVSEGAAGAASDVCLLLRMWTLSSEACTRIAGHFG